MTINRENIDRAYSEFDDSTLTLTQGEERLERLRFSRDIRELISRFPGDADLYHKLGLCLYDIPTWTDADRTEIELAFHRAILLDTTSMFSRVFLTHFYFDIGAYELSLAANPLDEAQSRIPNWRTVKLHELRICCQMHLNPVLSSGTDSGIQSYIAHFDGLPDDVRRSASPTHLLEAMLQAGYPKQGQLYEQITQLIPVNE